MWKYWFPPNQPLALSQPANQSKGSEQKSRTNHAYWLCLSLDSFLWKQGLNATWLDSLIQIRLSFRRMTRSYSCQRQKSLWRGKKGSTTLSYSKASNTSTLNEDFTNYSSTPLSSYPNSLKQPPSFLEQVSHSSVNLAPQTKQPSLCNPMYPKT